MFIIPRVYLIEGKKKTLCLFRVREENQEMKKLVEFREKIVEIRATTSQRDGRQQKASTETASHH